MLFDIGFIILALLCPAFVLIAYRQGVKDKQALDTGKPLEPVVRAPRRKPKPSEKDVYYNTLMDNINNFDGTDKGQKDVVI